MINEAAAAGLPILCSTHVGASLDFVIEGENGYLFSPYDRREIKEVIHKLFYMNDIKKWAKYLRGYQNIGHLKIPQKVLINSSKV